jgi:hypothetical protein
MSSRLVWAVLGATFVLEAGLAYGDTSAPERASAATSLADCVADLKHTRDRLAQLLPILKRATLTQKREFFHIGGRHPGSLGWVTFPMEIELRLIAGASSLVVRVRGPFEPWPPEVPHLPPSGWEPVDKGTQAGFPEGLAPAICEERGARDAQGSVCLGQLEHADMVADMFRHAVDRCLTQTRW